jgi:hypothetical protein
MPLLSDADLGLGSAPKTKLLTDEELLAPHPPRYLGEGGRALNDAEYAALQARGRQPSSLGPMGRIGASAGGMYMDVLRPDQPLGLSPQNFETVKSYVGGPIAGTLNAGLSAGDFALRGLAAPFHAAAGAIGQTANELGLSQGQGDTGPARDLLGLLDVAGIMGLPSTGARAPALSKPIAATDAAPVAKRLLSDAEILGAPGLQSKLDALTPTRAAENVFAKTAAPAQESLGAPQEFTPNFAGNINLTRIQAPEDVKNRIRDVARENAAFPEARRGKMTFDEIRQLAPLVGMSAEKLIKRGIGKTFNAEEMFAARTILVTQADEAQRLAKIAMQGGDADKLKALEAITRLAAIQEQVSGAAAEGGRLLGQFRMMAGANRSAENIKRVLDSAGGRVDDMLEGIAKLGDAPPEAVAGFVRKSFAARTSDQVLEAWINALLSGPVTHATNVLSNSLVAAWQVPEALASATISKATGSGITYREALARAFGLVEGAKDGLRAGYRAFLTEEPTGFAAKIEARNYRSIPSKTFRAGRERKEIGGFPIPLTGEIQLGGRQVRIPGRLLTGEDEFFKAINYRSEINALALRQGIAEGKRGPALARRVAELKSTPSDELATRARNAAERQTFTNPLGKFGRSLQSMASEVPVLRVVMPFIRTPVNIVKFAAERGPLAPLFKEVRENLRGPAAVRDQQIARIGLGSMVGAATAAYAADGTITGGGPADSKQRSVLYATGWQPYSIKIGDTYYSYGRLEPLGTLLGVAADFTELNKAMSEPEQANVAALIMGSVSKNLVSKTWLRGPAELIEAVQDPDRYGETYVRNLLGTIVPTGIAQTARTRDPYLREARSILDKIKERVPGYREELPLRRDLFGEPIKLEGGLGPDMISPIYLSVDAKDRVASEFVRLGVAPGRPVRNIYGVDLEAPEYEAYQKSAGQLAKTVLQRLLNSPGYLSLSDEAKRDVIDDVMRKTRDVGRAQTVQQFPDIALRAALLKQQKAARLQQ